MIGILIGVGELFDDTNDIVEDIVKSAKAKAVENVKAKAAKAKAEKNTKVRTENQIMDDRNGHNPILVEKINKIYNHEYGRMRTIVNALIARDYEEVTTKFPYFECFCEDDKICDYLMHTADDLDLEVIINFVRMKE